MFSILSSQPPFWKDNLNFDLIININIGAHVIVLIISVQQLFKRFKNESKPIFNY